MEKCKLHREKLLKRKNLPGEAKQQPPALPQAKPGAVYGFNGTFVNKS